MNLNEMQDLLNNLEEFFKVFVYSNLEQIKLRVYYDALDTDPGFKDIIYDMKGDFIK